MSTAHTPSVDTAQLPAVHDASQPAVLAPRPELDAARPAAERGTTTVDATAVERIVRQVVADDDAAAGAARRVMGVKAGGQDRDSAARASATVTGNLATVELSMSVRWPRPVLPTVHAVQDHVVTEVRRLTGIEVRRVDVTVAGLFTAAPTTRRVV